MSPAFGRFLLRVVWVELASLLIVVLVFVTKHGRPFETITVIAHTGNPHPAGHSAALLTT